MALEPIWKAYEVLDRGADHKAMLLSMATRLDLKQVKPAQPSPELPLLRVFALVQRECLWKVLRGMAGRVLASPHSRYAQDRSEEEGG